MLSRLASSKRATRSAAGPSSAIPLARNTLSLTTFAPTSAASSAATTSTNPAPQPSTSSFSPMRTRSGKRLIAPIAESVKAVKSKLTGNRRGTKAPETSAAAQTPTDAKETTTSSSGVPQAKPSPAPAKASTHKRSTTARGRSAKGKATKAKSAPKATTPSVPSQAVGEVPAPVAQAEPSSGPITAPSTNSTEAASYAATEATSAPRPRRFIPENRRLKREGAFYFDKDGRPLPQGTYPWDVEVKAAEPSLLEIVAREVSLEDLMRPRKLVPGSSIYPGTGYETKRTFVYEPLDVRLPPVEEPIASITGPAQPEQPAAKWEPIVFPSVPARNSPSPEPTPASRRRLTRQYAVFLDRDDETLLEDKDANGELEQIGDIVANILKADTSGALSLDRARFRL
ncbi:hypothetical protein BN946_scf185016.g28 [Trametes cinnabarina]|uniref:Uncharacterized protein n=1 Tax=Pycnoporus cinnabarinus TaxID=5643 RepID=A0A060SI82_PYCCI|nr:hypothetical protein BN946_scf185016.g28 [Trametes cinnabarina]